MKKFLFIAVLFLSSHCIPSLAADFSTPENALKSLEEAYKNKNIEAAVAAKDFYFEASVMLISARNSANPDKKLIQETARILELSYRKQILKEGFADFSQFHCSIVKISQLKPDLVEMIEECLLPDGDKSSDQIHAFKSDIGWRIVILPE